MEKLCSYCIKQHWLWSGVPLVQRVSGCKHDSHGNCLAFHGTAYCLVPNILEVGLKPKRESGMVYFSPLPARAETYAKSWAVGMHACGATNELRACVLSFPLLEDEEYHREDSLDFAVLRSVEPSELSEHSIDLSDFSPETSEYIGYLESFISIVGFYPDPYSDEGRYSEMHQHAKKRLNELIECVSPVVYFRSRYVSRA